MSFHLCLLSVLTAVALSGCCGDGECNQAEGARCSATFQCNTGLTCFEQECHFPCASQVDCRPGLNCVPEALTPGASGPADLACVPAPTDTERWSIRVARIAGAHGGVGEVGEPDPFVCLVVDQRTLCTEEQTGIATTFTKDFLSTFATPALATTSVTAYESDALGVFPGCEGACDTLVGWDKEVLLGLAIDARPLWSRHGWSASALGADGVRVDVDVIPSD